MIDQNFSKRKKTNKIKPHDTPQFFFNNNTNFNLLGDEILNCNFKTNVFLDRF